MSYMKFENEELRLLYDKAASFFPLLYLDAFFGRATENSIYRKKAISYLNLTPNSTILDVACGIGFNFKILESYLRNSGKLVGIDISSKSLELAKSIVIKHGWTNIELVNMSITDYEPEIFFDAILCTYALEIIPDYKLTIDKIFNLLKPQGRFAIIGMKSFPAPSFLSSFLEKLYKVAGIDVHRDIILYIKSRFNKIYFYEECFFGSYYILSTSKPIS